MKTFNYVATEHKPSKGTIEAESLKEAFEKLKPRPFELDNGAYTIVTDPETGEKMEIYGSNIV